MELRWNVTYGFHLSMIYVDDGLQLGARLENAEIMIAELRRDPLKLGFIVIGITMRQLYSEIIAI
jgi:hypothetical protein